VRTPEEITRVINQNPFPKIDTSTIYVTFLELQPGLHAADELKSHQSKSEKFVVAGREIYLHYPDGYGKTKLTNALIEKKLTTIATTRNWRTITTLLAMAAR
jgi:uncharacterized protein (DUF1697 family)